MPKPTSKTELITAANEQWDKLWKLLATLPAPQTILFSFSDDPKLKEAHWRRDKNLRDVFTHLYEWHMLLLDWVESNMEGTPHSFLPEPYTWKSYGDMNTGFWEKHQSTSYENAAAMLRESHSKVLHLMESMSDEELFEKKHYPWTGTTNIGSYCISATSGHYAWAMKKIKQYLKRQN